MPGRCDTPPGFSPTRVCFAMVNDDAQLLLSIVMMTLCVATSNRYTYNRASSTGLIVHWTSVLAIFECRTFSGRCCTVVQVPLGTDFDLPGERILNKSM